MFCLGELFFILNITQYKAQETLKTEKMVIVYERRYRKGKENETEDEKNEKNSLF